MLATRFWHQLRLGEIDEGSVVVSDQDDAPTLSFGRLCVEQRAQREQQGAQARAWEEMQDAEERHLW
jgi:hypothetical protein